MVAPTPPRAKRPTPLIPRGNVTSATAGLASLTAVVVLGVHLRALSGQAAWGLPILAVSSVVAFGCFAAFVLRERERRPRPVVAVFSGGPVWGRLLVHGTLLYAALNFILFVRTTGAFATPTRSAQVTAEQRPTGAHFDASVPRRTDTWPVRVVSAHLLPLLVVPALYYYVLSRQSRGATGEQ
jgi:hypothetical protein